MGSFRRASGSWIRATAVFFLIFALVSSCVAPPILAAQAEREEQRKAEPQSLLAWLAGAGIAAGVGAGVGVLIAYFNGKRSCAELVDAALGGAADGLVGYIITTILFPLSIGGTSVSAVKTIIDSIGLKFAAVAGVSSGLPNYFCTDFWDILSLLLGQVVGDWLESLGFGAAICGWGGSVWNCTSTLKDDFVNTGARDTFEEIGQEHSTDGSFAAPTITITTPSSGSGAIRVEAFPATSNPAQEIEYVEFEYRTSSSDWASLPSLSPDAANRDWYGENGYGFSFDTETAGIVYDTGVQVRARASGSFGKMSEWATSGTFLVNNREIEVAVVAIDRPVYQPGDQAQVTAGLVDQSGTPLAGATAEYDIIRYVSGPPGVIVDSGTLSAYGGGAYGGSVSVPTDQGDYAVQVRATKTGYQGNNGGRAFQISASLALGIISSTESPVAQQAVTFTASAANPVDVYVWDFGDGSTGTGSPIVHVYASTGNRTVTLTAYDQYGNSESVQRAFSVGSTPSGGDVSLSSTWVDGTPAFSGGPYPRLHEFYVRFQGSAAQAPACNDAYDVRAVDLATGIVLGTSQGNEYTMGGSGSSVRAMLERSVFRTPGWHTVRLYARHANGDTAQSDVAVQTVVSDNSRRITIFPSSPVSGEWITLDASHISTDTGGNSITGYRWTVRLADPPYTIIYQGEGSHLGSIQARPTVSGEYTYFVGNTSGYGIDDGDFYVYEPDEIDPDLRMHTWSVPSTCVVGRNLQVSYTLRNYGRNIAHYIARFAVDGTTRHLEAHEEVGECGLSEYREETETVSLRNLSLGQHTIRFTLVDSMNAESSWQKTVTVVSNQAPSASIDQITPSPAASGESISFHASASDQDGSIASVQWRFGDGQTAIGLETSHTYSEPGSYDVVVEAFDDLGASVQRSTTLVVERGLPPQVEDLTASSDQEHGIDLAWTNPADPGLLEVIVVRKPGADCPGSRADGEPVFQSTTPISSGAVEFTDVEVIPGDTYSYAVFSRNENGWNDSVAAGRNCAQGEAVDRTPPTVADVTPSDRGAGIPVNTAVRIQFSECMNRSTVENAFSLSDGAQEIQGTFSWDAIDRSVTFTPSAPLQEGRTYYIELQGSSGPEDTAGNAMASGFSSSFESNMPDTAAVFRVAASGDVLADGTTSAASFATGAADVAEWVEVSEAVEPGMVVELDPTSPLAYRPSRTACSPLVAGVISTEPGVEMGLKDHSSGTALLALVGIVPLWVTDEGGPIEPGDLLVSSSTPGHAMRWDGEGLCPCTLVGKALEPLIGAQGLILVLLTAH